MPFFKQALCATALLIGLFLSPTAYSIEMVDRIVAVVGDGIITYQDLTDRLRLAAKNIQSELTRTQQKELLHTQLNELIEEELLLQYAKKNGHTTTQAQLQKTIANIEKRNKQEKGSFLAFAGKEKASALRSIRVSLLTQLITQAELRPQTNVSNQEVERIVQGILSRKNEATEKSIAQIFLPVSENSEEEKTRKSIYRLHHQLLNGKKFENLARAYSRDRSATDGGALGWFRLQELVPTIENAVSPLKKGQISKPTRSANGWHIFKVLDVRMPKMVDLKKTHEYKLSQLYAPIDSTLGTPAPLQNKHQAAVFKTLTDKVKSLQDFTRIIDKKKKESPLYMASGPMGWIKSDTLEPPLKAALEGAQKNQTIGPVSTDNGTYLFYVADIRKKESAALEGIKVRVKERLVARQTDLALRRLVRDLRRRTFVEIRL